MFPRFRRACSVAVLLGAALLVSCSACKKTPALPAVRVTRISIAGAGDDASPSARRLLDAAGRGLSQAGVQVQLAPAQTGAGDFALRLSLQMSPVLADDGATPKAVRLLCAGTLSGRGGQARGTAVSTTVNGSEAGEGAAAPTWPELAHFEHVGMSERPWPHRGTDGGAAGNPLGSPSADDGEALVALLARLVEDSCKTLGAELQLLQNDSPALMALLGKADVEPPLRATAMQILGRRKERAALPLLIAEIKKGRALRQDAIMPEGADAPEERGAGGAAADGGAGTGRDGERMARMKAAAEAQVQSVLRDSAIGAILDIGDPKAVRPLVDSVAFTDEVEMGKILEAVATLGGDEARQYLQFVATGHPEAAIRAEARTALSHMDGRAGGDRANEKGGDRGKPADGRGGGDRAAP